ncbi:TonB-dependent receptor [Membranihabitans marinus]|uniref:TonB-dependent receptor n=1 Tax=Membranihabitans marinus TaxID=1227546 RepID=UPI001F23E54B|nr:TonB-dependent receptor [Membranihabitans marinus]
MLNRMIGWLIPLVLMPVMVFSQAQISGQVIDDKGQSIIGVHFKVLPSGRLAVSDENGYFSIDNISSQDKELHISHIGYESQSKEITEDLLRFNKYILNSAQVISDEIVVQGIRAAENTGTTFQNIDKEEIAAKNIGQDLPYLLQMTPSIVVTSDAGHGIGYTGMRIRGSDGTRINATINGIPLNNAESQGSFWINLPDFASSVESLQIQRGVGTSTNGAGAFGASLNISTNTLNREGYIVLNNSLGSFNSIKNTIGLGTGLINEKFSLDARLSRITSDGFIDRATSDLSSLYLSGAWYGNNHILRFNIISGKEKTYQAWNGVPESKLDDDRTFNEFTYEDQTDNYTQSHFQLHYSQQLATNWNWNISLNYTPGKGYYEEDKKGQSFSDYSLTPIVIGDTTISSTDLIRRRWLDNHFYGFTSHTTWSVDPSLEMTAGLGFFQYKGLHFGEILWAEYASTSNIYDRYYENDALKNDGNVYLKTTKTMDKTSLYLDLQLRNIYYSFLGLNRNGEEVEQEADLLFFNPKFGLSHVVSPSLSVYASLSKGSREPNRNDYTESSIDSRPKPEQLYDFEAGVKLANEKLNLETNLYYMYYVDQLVLTGEINDVGSYVRSNVDQSYRAGLEINAQYGILPELYITGNLGLSSNKIKDYTQYVDEYDVDFNLIGQSSENFESTVIGFSPSCVAGLGWVYSPFKNASIGWETKYVSRQYLDNTENESRSIDPFSFSNIRLNYLLTPPRMKEVRFGLDLKNIFGAAYETNGYTYGYYYNGVKEDYNFYYPQAGFHFMFSLNIKI